MAASMAAALDHSPDVAPVRIAFRQPVTDDGLLDAAWWPRSRDLESELPGLLDTLWLAGRDVVRVSYALDYWDRAPRRLRVDGRVVRMGGFHTQIPGLLTLLDAWGRERINVMVVPPDTPPAVADRALALVAGDPNADHPDQVLEHARDQLTAGADDRRHVDANARNGAWEDDGGQLSRR
jgi:hypothetical protein